MMNPGDALVAFMFAVAALSIVNFGSPFRSWWGRGNHPDHHAIVPEVHGWLTRLGLEKLSPRFLEESVDSLVKITLINTKEATFVQELSPEDIEVLELGILELRNRLVLHRWLWKHNYHHLLEPLLRVDVRSLIDLANYAEDDESRVQLLSEFQGNIPDLIAAKHELSRSHGHLDKLQHTIYKQLVYESNLKTKKMDEGGGEDIREKLFRFIVCVSTLFVTWFLWDLGVTPNDIFAGIPVYKSRTKVIWPSDLKTANTISVKVNFFTFKGNPIKDVLKQFDPSQVVAKVTHSSGRTVESSIAEPSPEELCIIFSGRVAGMYEVTLIMDDHVVRGFPASATIIAGEPHPGSTSLPGLRSKTFVVRTSSQALGQLPNHWWHSDTTTLNLEVRDRFGNPLEATRYPDLVNRFSVGIWKRNSKDSTEEEASLDLSTYNAIFYHNLESPCQIQLSLVFNEGHEGWYKAQINLDGQPIASKSLSIIVLNTIDYLEVERLLEKRSDRSTPTPTFEAEILSPDPNSGQKPRKVYTYLTPKQLVIKEYFLKFIPRKLFTFRLSPATRVELVSFKKASGSGVAHNPILMVEDGCQTCQRIQFKNGMVFVAAYHLSLLRRMGGSLSFSDKQKVFNAKLVEFHESKGHRHVRLPLTIDRNAIVDSSMKAVKWFNDSDWCRLIEITFDGEPGLDQGGVRREWYELLCKKLFHPSFGLFVQAEDGSEAVHPNAKASPQVMKRMFNFAGRMVGKCLLESAYGATYRQLFPPRLAMSFLAQIVGLRVRYQHFADDSPQFYTAKIHFLLNQSVEDEGNGLEDLYFVEDEYDGQLVRTVELKPNGSSIKVTEANKLEYLDSLAQHRLANKFKEQTELFLEGLYSLVPESLLSVFDESELELLLCGVREYDLEDWQRNHFVVRDGYLTHRAIKWFWIAISNFTPEQHAKLLRFATGSSQLPPGGFAELKPTFQISGMEKRNVLPTSHTCFNMICLSDHDSYESFERSVLTAVEEGCEGFGLV